MANYHPTRQQWQRFYKELAAAQNTATVPSRKLYTKLERLRDNYLEELRR